MHARIPSSGWSPTSPRTPPPRSWCAPPDWPATRRFSDARFPRSAHGVSDRVVIRGHDFERHLVALPDVGVLEAVTCQHAHHGLVSTDAPLGGQAPHPGHTRGGRGLADDPLERGDGALSVEDVLVADRFNEAARLVARRHGTLPRRRVADPDGGGDRLRQFYRGAADDGSRSIGL